MGFDVTAFEQDNISRFAVAELTVLPQVSIGGDGLDSESVNSPSPTDWPLICHVTVPHVASGCVSVPVTVDVAWNNENVLLLVEFQ